MRASGSRRGGHGAVRLLAVERLVAVKWSRGLERLVAAGGYFATRRTTSANAAPQRSPLPLRSHQMLTHSPNSVNPHTYVPLSRVSVMTRRLPRGNRESQGRPSGYGAV